MNEIKEFMFGESDAVRTVTDEKNDPWFVAKDICDILELSNPSMSLKNLDNDERAKLSLGRQGETNIISESGLYTLLVRSRSLKATPFRRWVTHVVLPSIRKTGAYLAPEVDFTDPANLLTILENWRADRVKLERATKEVTASLIKVRVAENKVALVKPKVDFHDTIAKSVESIKLGVYARNLASSGIDIGRTRLFEFFREQGYIDAENNPYQYFIDLGVMTVHPNPWISVNGNCHNSYTPYITGKGQAYFLKKILKLYV